jgi:hypothetical protein
MEEGFEVEARLEPREKSEYRLTTAIAVTTAALAVFAAYSSLLAGQSAHHSLAALNRAAIFQSQASDQWNFYQAEGIKRHVFETQRDALRLQPGAPAAALAAGADKQAKRYRAQQDQIRKDAEALERQRDEAKAGAQVYDIRYQRLALAVTFFQIAIVVSSVAAIVRRAPLWYLGLLGGTVGAIFLVQAILMPVGEARPG